MKLPIIVRNLSLWLMGAVTLLSPSESFPASWSEWTKRPEPIFMGEYIASDPSIIKEGSIYRMFYSCMTGMSFDLWNFVTGQSSIRTALCQATSRDGFSWEHISDGDEVKGLMLKGRTGRWDENIEGCFAIKDGSEYLLFFSGYPEEGEPAKGFPAALGVARSIDGRQFTRASDTPILSPTPGWYDNDAIYSPTMIHDGNEFVMIYAAHCYTRCDNGPAVVLVAATSQDGRQWNKKPTPVLQLRSDIPWMQDGVAEPGLLKGPDGFYYLFVSGIQGERGTIGIARSASLSGPWTINPTPILTPSTTPGAFDESNVLAPYVIIEGDKVRMWFLGSNKEQMIRVGYAESTWPLYTD